MEIKINNVYKALVDYLSKSGKDCIKKNKLYKIIDIQKDYITLENIDTRFHIEHFSTIFQEHKTLKENYDYINPSHYNNDKGSLYQFCEDKQLNSYEFDIIKRIMRCRKKGNFKEDLEKTKFLIDLYLKEFKTENIRSIQDGKLK